MRAVLKKCKMLLFALVFVLGGALVSCADFALSGFGTSSKNSSVSSVTSSKDSSSKGGSSSESKDDESSQPQSSADKDDNGGSEENSSKESSSKESSSFEESSKESSSSEDSSASKDDSSSKEENSSFESDSTADSSSSKDSSVSESTDSSTSDSSDIPDGSIVLTVHMHDVAGSVELRASAGVSLSQLISDNFTALVNLYVTGNTGAGTADNYNVEFFQNGFWQKGGDLIFLEDILSETNVLAFTASGVGFTVLFYDNNAFEPAYYPLPPLNLQDFVEWMYRNDLFSMDFESSLDVGVWEIDGYETTDGESVIGNEVRFTLNEHDDGGDGGLDEFTVYGIQLYSATDPDGASKMGMSTYSTPVTVEQIYNEHFAHAEEYYTFTLYKNGERVSLNETITSDCCIVGVIDEIEASWDFSVQISCGEQMETYNYYAPVSVLDVAQRFCAQYSLGKYDDYSWYENEQIAFSFEYFHLFAENATLTGFANNAPPSNPSSYQFTYYIDNDDGNGAVKNTVELDSREIKMETFAREYMGLAIPDEAYTGEYAFFEGYSGMNELDSTSYVTSEYSIWAIKRSALSYPYTVTYTFIPTWGYQFETRTQELYFPCTLETLLYELSDVPTNSVIPDAYLYEIDGEEIDLGKGDWGKLYYYDITLKISPVYHAFVQVNVWDEGDKSQEYVSYKPIVLSKLWEDLGLSKTPTAYSWKVNEQYYYDNALNDPVFLDVGRMGHTIVISARTVHLAVTFIDEQTGQEMTLGYRGMPEDTGWEFSVSAQKAWDETVGGFIEFDDFTWTLYAPMGGEQVDFTDLSTEFVYVALPADQIEWWDMESAYKTVYKLYGERKS